MPTSFSYIVLRLFTFPLLLLQSLQNPKILLLRSLPLLSYYFATKYFAADIKFPGVVELTTQLLILENILWLPLCRINEFGLNTLPSKTVAIPHTCGLSKPFSSAIEGEHNSILWVTWDIYLLIIMKNLRDPKTKIYPSTTRVDKELPSSSTLDSPSVLSNLATHHLLLILICRK